MEIRVLVLLLTIAVTENAVPSAPATIEYRMRSNLSGRYVRVGDNGAITANGNPKSSSVFTTYSKNDRVQFELKSKPGMFVMLKELNHSIVDDSYNTSSLPMNVTANQTVVHEYVLVVDYPSEPYLTEWEKIPTSGALVQKVDENTTCAISFDSSGKVAGPCNLSALQLDTMTLVPAPM